MGEDAYGFKPGGSLKFKDRDAEKKKKKKSKSSTSNGVKVSASSTSSAAVPLASSSSTRASGSTAEGQGAPSGESLSIERTDAERRFDEIQRKRLSEKVKTEAKKSHKDKVDKFNTYLESLSEHYDIPKVGPG